MNRPYVKQYLDGELLNPIIGSLYSRFPNRKTRRQSLGRLASNKKGTQLVVTQIGHYKFSKYYKVFQNIGKKRIVHYIETKN